MNGEQIACYAVKENGLDLKSWEYTARPLGDEDVTVGIQYSGVCHSDLHSIKGEWGPVTEPTCPGHEIVGVVTEVGGKARKFKVGDLVGIGPQVLSCGKCRECAANQDQYCGDKQSVFLFSPAKRYPDGPMAQGGYSRAIRAHQRFVHAIPDGLPADVAPPLLCAGVTTYKPLVDAKVGKGSRVGVVGIGGLGHLAVQWAAKMGAEVIAISGSERKRDEAAELGAAGIIASSDTEAMKAKAGYFDVIVMTASASLDWNLLLSLLAPNGTFVFLGAPGGGKLEIPLTEFIFRSINVTGSLIGSPKETEEMLQFAAKHGVRPWCHKMNLDDCADAVRMADDNKLPAKKYRIVLDVKDGSKKLQ